MSTPPAWYPDPSPEREHGGLRWWDGATWTAHTASPAPDHPTALPSPGGPSPAPRPIDPRQDLDGERRAGRAARTAVLVGAAVIAGNLVLYAVVAPAFWTVLRDYLDSLENLAPGAAPPRFVLSRGMRVVQAASPLFSLAFIVVQVLFATWLYRASELARRAGLPLRRTPTMAVAGLFIPVVNFWWPYQSVSSLFPAGSPRPRIGLWWTLHLCSLLLAIPSTAVAFVSVPAGVVVALVCAVVPVGEALLARSIIDAVERAHTTIVEVD